MLRRIPPSSPFYEQAQIEVAGGLLARERTGEALGVLQAAARPAGAQEAKFAYANLLAGENRHNEAIAAYTKLIDRLPPEPPEDAWRFLVARGASYLVLDQWPAAEADLKRAVEIAPKEAAALNYLGYSWAERGENLDEAFGLIENAVAIEPNSGAYIDSLGWAHYQRSDYDEAVGHLEHAASLEPGDPTITDHLGDVYWRLGRKIEAGYQWRRVLELEPDDKLRAAVEAKLEKGLTDAQE
jgi:tetratricopeptide (TPR) repeat protein